MTLADDDPKLRGSTKALRELWSVHAELRDGIVWFNGPPTTTLRDLWSGMDATLTAFPQRNGGRRPEEFLNLFSYGDDRSALLDVATHDTRGDPMVREWVGEQFELVGEKTPFWPWFETNMPLQLLHEPGR